MKMLIMAEISPFVGALSTIVGVYLGYIISKKQLKEQMNLKLKNTALVLVDEIESIEKIIKPFADYYEEHGIDFISDTKTNPIANLIQSEFFCSHELTTEVIDFFYDEKAAYYRYHEIIPNFDEESFANITEFYRNLMFAQNYSKLYREGKGNFYLKRCYEHLIKALQNSQVVKDSLKTKYKLK
jgi:hypothetical protein